MGFVANVATPPSLSPSSFSFERVLLPELLSFSEEVILVTLATVVELESITFLLLESSIPELLSPALATTGDIGDSLSRFNDLMVFQAHVANPDLSVSGS